MNIFISKKQLAAYICIAALVLALSVGAAYWRSAYVARVPILMYHHISDSGEPGSTIPPETFESQIKALADAGYTAISFEELHDHVTAGTPLPELPIMITFDDGYMSVYDIAFPILKKYNMKATAFIIGIFHGQSIYKGMKDLRITPHFGDAEAREMASSGVISIQSHSYDMHQFIPYERSAPREGILRRDDESMDEYIEAFVTDFTLAADQIENITGERPFVYSYPFGRSTRLSERLLKEMGVTVTLTTKAKINTVIKGAPWSLYKLGRINVPADMTAEQLLEAIGYQRSTITIIE